MREIDELKDKIDRLLKFAGQAGVAFTMDDSDLITEGFLALPDDIQELINNEERNIMNELDRA